MRRMIRIERLEFVAPGGLLVHNLVSRPPGAFVIQK